MRRISCSRAASTWRSSFPRLLEHSTLYFSARDVLSFLGRKWHGKFEGEVVTDQFDHGFNGRLPGRRVKHRMKRNRSEEHTSELQSQSNLVCRLLLEKKKKKNI